MNSERVDERPPVLLLRAVQCELSAHGQEEFRAIATCLLRKRTYVLRALTGR
jgi:hypothetical protein